MTIFLNVALRLTLLYFLAEVILFADDPRFADKAIPLRNLIIVGGLSLLFPALHFATKRWSSYPFGLDSLYLSIFWLDMAGNSFNLYDTYYYFDLLPHFYAPGVVAVIAMRAFGFPVLSAAGLANTVHIALEAQEHYTDVLFGTHNVRGVSDVVNDLAVGLVATILFPAGLMLLEKRRRSQA
jgi:hypothetical protein